MNKLDKIFDKYSEHLRDADGEFEGDFLDKEDFKKAAIDFAKHILEEASNSAELTEVSFYSEDGVCQTSTEMGDNYELNKESITSVINKYL
jgi:hypothetical protein